MTPCSAQSSFGRAMPMTMMDTTYDSLHYPFKFWLGNANDNDGYNL